MHGRLNQFDRRKQRVRRTLAQGGSGRPRLSVFRSSKHIYAQVIDDAQRPHGGCRLEPGEGAEGRSSRPAPTRRPQPPSASCWPSARARPASSKVVFDRGGYRYHGRIKALADGGARRRA